MKKTTSTRQGARERILLTAHDLFYREGIRATGVDRLIAESGVTKTTFYRHFPSKHDLVLACLEYRHHRWISWLDDALERRGRNLDALVAALKEWFQSGEFRGCAFINSVGEVGAEIPAVEELTRRHKQELKQVIARLVPANRTAAERDKMASAVALLIDGAIVKTQFDKNGEDALRALRWALKSLE